MMVHQEDDFGCGVACVANRLQISYGQALRLFDNPAAARDKGYACKYIVRALRNAGVEAKLKHISVHKKRPTFEPDDIVFLAKSERYPFQHYLIRTDQGWIDPWINMHTDKNVINARAGIRKILPGRPYYYITSRKALE